MAALAAAGALVMIFILIFAIALYVVEGLFLFKLNKLMYGKGTALAWIPFCNTYLLGKLTINKIAGWILVGCTLITTTFTINGVEYTILPSAVSSVISKLTSFVTFGLFIYAIVKYLQMKKENNSTIKTNENIVNPNITNFANNQVPNEMVNNQNFNQINNNANINSYNNVNDQPTYNNPNPINQNESVINNNYQNNGENLNINNQLENQTVTNNTFNQNNVNSNNVNNNVEPQNQFNDSIFNQNPLDVNNPNNSNNFTQGQQLSQNPDASIFTQGPAFPSQSVDSNQNNT